MKTEQYEIWKPYVELAVILFGVGLACFSAVICKFARCAGKKVGSQKYNKFVNELNSDAKCEAIKKNTQALEQLAYNLRISNEIQLRQQLDDQEDKRKALEKVKKMISETPALDTFGSTNAVQNYIETGVVTTEDGIVADGIALLGNE